MLERIFGGLALSSVLLLTRGLLAQDIAAAEALFRRGVDDFRAGKYTMACRELGDSYRMDPLPGVLFTLAACESRAGRIATAAARYQDFLQLVANLPPSPQGVQDERREMAIRELGSLAPEIPHLTLRLPDALVATSTVRRDGTVIGTASVGVELPVDPGEHEISVEAQGGARRVVRVTVARREHRVVDLSPLETAPAPDRAEERSPANEPRSMVPWVYIAGSAAIAGVVLGSVTGILAIREKNIVDSSCAGPSCNAAGKQAADAGKLDALVSNIGFGFGIVGLAATAVLWTTQAHSPAAAPTKISAKLEVSVSTNSLVFAGRF